MPSAVDLKRAILKVLIQGGTAYQVRQEHKFNLIGRGSDLGALERMLGAKFTLDDRVRANKAFEDLKRDGYIQSTFRDLADPENWVEATALGRDYFARDLKDDIDLKLEAIAPHLLEMRRGMWDAVDRTSADAPRQAAHSARELLDQLLKHGAPETCTTRKQRFRHLMQANIGSKSKSDLDILEASATLIEAEHNSLIKNAHMRGTPNQKHVRASVEATERILTLLFGA